MGIYFTEGVYGIKCVDTNGSVLLEVTKKTKYSGEEINQILQVGKKFLVPFDLYFYKEYSTTYDLNSSPDFMWVKIELNKQNQQI